MKAVKRSDFEKAINDRIERSGDINNLRPTLERALDVIESFRVDSQITGANTDGKECLLTLMGLHVYTWFSHDMIEAFKDCSSKVIEVTEEDTKFNNTYILIMSENDKRIFQVN